MSACIFFAYIILKGTPGNAPSLTVGCATLGGAFSRLSFGMKWQTAEGRWLLVSNTC